MLTTDVFREGVSKHIYYYAGGEVNAKLFWAQYDEEGRLTDCNEELDVSFVEGFANLSYQTYIPDGCRIFHWSEDMKPLCAVIEVE